MMFESPEQCRRMGDASERIIREKINIEIVSERYMAAFREFMKVSKSL